MEPQQPPTSPAATPPFDLQTEEPPCPVCQAEEARPLFPCRDVILGKPGDFGVVRCRACGLAYLRPRPAPESLGFYYADVYSGPAREAMRKVQTEGAVTWLLAGRWRLLRRHVALGPTDRVLDLGCGYGGFLRRVQEGAGCQVYGVDTDRGSIEGSVCLPGAQLFVGELADAAFEPESFKAIALLHSLEHLSDPVSTLRHLRSLLRPDGKLFVEVPNFASPFARLFRNYWFPLLVPQHLSFFEPGTLSQTLQRAGFPKPEVLRPSWAPGELTFALGLWLRDRLGRAPTPTNPEPKPGFLGMVFGFLLLLLLLFVDLPLGVLQRWLGLSGHMVALVGRGPAPLADAPPAARAALEPADAPTG